MGQNTSYQQGIRLFFSIDLTQSTMFKTNDLVDASTRNDIATKWPQIFQLFFSQILRTFIQRVEEVESRFLTKFGRIKISFWKILGDEIFFYSSKITSEEHAIILSHIFVELIEEYDKMLIKNYEMGIRGTIWTAGFPLRNKEIYIDPSNAPFFWINDLEKVNERVGAIWASPNLRTDYIGPDIDLGFVISEVSEPRRVIIALDLAILISRVESVLDFEIRVFHLGWKSFKAIHSSTPYPIIWIDTLKKGAKPVARTSFEQYGKFSKNYLNLNGIISKKRLLKLNLRHFDKTKEYRLEEPYIATDELPFAHDEKWKNQNT